MKKNIIRMSVVVALTVAAGGLGSAASGDGHGTTQAGTNQYCC